MKKYSALILSAFLSSLPFIFPNTFFLTLIFPSVLFFFVFTSSKKECVKYTFVWSFVYYLVVYSFFISLYPLDFAGLSNIASVGVVLLGMVGVSLVHSAEITLVFAIAKRFCKNTDVFSALFYSCAFVLGEYIQSLGFLGFAWANVFLTQYKFLPFIQSASLFGNYFVSFIIVFISSLNALFFIKRKKSILVFSISLFILNCLFGVVTMRVGVQSNKTVDVAIIQPSIVTGEKWDTSKGKTLFELHMALTQECKDADMILWPETAVSHEICESEEELDAVKAFTKERENTLVVGTFLSQGDKIYNSAIPFEKGIMTSPYFKRRLVPFGEYVPAREFFETFLPFITDINMLSYDLSAGQETNVFDTSFGKVGALICFDSIFPNLARESVRDGAELLAIITNDSWYKDSKALSHHNAQAVFRAVENRRWVVRCANTGISSFIDPFGRVVYETDPYEQVSHTESVELVREKTLFVLTGNVFVVFLLIYYVAFCVNSKVRKTKKSDCLKG